MRVLYKTFPKGVLSGTVPDSCKTRKPSSSISTRYTAAAHGTHRDNFTKEDLAAIQDKLDEALLSSKYMLGLMKLSDILYNSAHRTLTAYTG